MGKKNKSKSIDDIIQLEDGTAINVKLILTENVAVINSLDLDNKIEKIIKLLDELHGFKDKDSPLNCMPIDPVVRTIMDKQKVIIDKIKTLL